MLSYSLLTVVNNQKETMWKKASTYWEEICLELLWNARVMNNVSTWIVGIRVWRGLHLTLTIENGSEWMFNTTDYDSMDLVSFQAKVAQSCLTLCDPVQFMEFSRPEYWSGYPLPFPEDLPNQGLNPCLPHCW